MSIIIIVSILFIRSTSLVPRLILQSVPGPMAFFDFYLCQVLPIFKSIRPTTWVTLAFDADGIFARVMGLGLADFPFLSASRFLAREFVMLIVVMTTFLIFAPPRRTRGRTHASVATVLFQLLK